MRGLRSNGITAGACISMALMLLVLPLKWLCAAAVAATFHELCHRAAIRFCTGRETTLRLSALGASMQIPDMTRGRELICALSGPLGSLLLLVLARWFPRIAVCALLQSSYNLLPVYPLDGGRALRCGASLLLPPAWAERICRWIECGCYFVITAVGFWACFAWKLGVIPLLPAFMILLKTKAAKSSCKPALLGVQ